MMRYLVSCCAALVATSCSSTADLSRHYDAESTSFCGVSIGRDLPRTVERRAIWVEPEGVPEQRYVAEFCNNKVTGQLVLGEDSVLQQIIFITRGYCLGGVCIGDSFPQVRARHPRLKLFITPEEGGLLTLRESSGRVRYTFDTGSIPGRCFDNIDACPNEWSSATVSAIIIGAPD